MSPSRDLLWARARRLREGVFKRPLPQRGIRPTVGPELGRCLNDVPDGFGWLQYELAKDQQRPILQWRSPDLRDLQGIETTRKSAS